jgi:hypothetical protein
MSKYKREELESFVKKLKENGFAVYAFQHDTPIGQVFFVKDNKIATVSCDDFYGLRFGTTHKPNRSCGTGFGLNENATTEPTIEMAMGAINTLSPYWYHGKDQAVKYSGWDEYLKKNSLLKYYEV